MKILKICGKNLASLAGEFEVDFQQEPLASTGLFAICGPTGAGKSTLLDALCLALYDATPRLSKAGSKGIGLPDVRDETVTPHDTRNLLRRGTAEGYAEVDFIGNDQTAYRARWSVRRARTKADGALQAVGMSLRRLPDLHPIGGTNREVKSEIEQRIGLSFEQFIRAVLLAQNEFFAFLKADDGERGELLETLTGTAVYSEISKRAHERSKAENQALQRLTALLANQKPLTDDERTQLEAERLQAEAVVMSLEQRKNMLEEQLRWHRSLAQSRQAEHLAQAYLAESETRHRAAADRRTTLSLVEAAQAARPLIADCDRCTGELAQAREAVAAAEIHASQADAEHREAAEAAATARRILTEAEQAHATAAPLLDRAKILDVQLVEGEPAHAGAERALNDAQASKALVLKAMDENTQQRTYAHTEKERAEAWLQSKAALRLMAAEWPRWDALLTQAAQANTDQNAAETALAGVLAEQTRLAAACAEASRRLAFSAEACAGAEKRYQDCTARMAAFDPHKLALQRQAAETQREDLASGEKLWSDLCATIAQRAQLEDKLGRLQQAIGTAQQTWEKVQQQIPAAAEGLAQAERSLRYAEAACGNTAESLRAALEPDVPCPVCGSESHPYTNASPQLRAALEALSDQVTQCRAQHQHLLQQCAEQDALLASYREQHRLADEELGMAGVAVQRKTLAWEAHALAPAIKGLDDAESRVWFREQQAAVRDIIQQISREEQAARDAAQKRDNALEALNVATRNHAQRKEDLVTMQASLDKATSASTAIAQQRESAGQRLKRLLDELGAAFGSASGPEDLQTSWQQSWQQSPEAFHAHYRVEVDAWNARRAVHNDMALLLDKLDGERKSLEDKLARAEGDVRHAEDVYTGCKSRLDELRSARAGAFGGKPVSEVESALSSATRQAKAALALCVERQQHCAAAQARWTEALDQAKQRHAALERAAKAAASAVNEWLAAFNASRTDDEDSAPAREIDMHGLRALLEHGAQWMSNERDQLHAIRGETDKARAVLHERRAQRDALEQLHSTTESAEAVAAALDSVTSERRTVGTRATEIQLAIAADEARHKNAASMQVEIAKQEAMTRTWAQLADLIGSADGKKFRNYAQQFTLDVLLGYANRHLDELARRYRLQRVKDTLALMVVDQDMGDEMRSVHSLSGGESFLVSLALALGLASLSSNRVRVESLFIDEGFGSLDADTLSVAMDALDGLQSLGRKVGVISHVQEMTDRIATKVLVKRTTSGKSFIAVS